MIIGIAGSFGAGKGETAWKEAVARPCLQLCEYLEQGGDKVYSACKAPVPDLIGSYNIFKFL